MANEYDIGDRVRLTATFTDADDVATDPDNVSIFYTDPSGNETEDDAPTKSATGIYYTDINLDEAGKWKYRSEGTAAGGDYQGAEKSHFYVTPN